MTLDELIDRIWQIRATVVLVGETRKDEEPRLRGVTRDQIDAEMAAALKEHRDAIIDRLRATRCARLEGLQCGRCHPEVVPEKIAERDGAVEIVRGGRLPGRRTAVGDAALPEDRMSMTLSRPRGSGGRGPITSSTRGYLVFVCDLGKATDRVVGRRSNRKYATKLAAELNGAALAANGGNPTLPCGRPVPLYYVVSSQGGE